MASQTPASEATPTPPEYATIDVTYSVTLPGRYEQDTDKEGKPRTKKDGSKIMRPVKLQIPVTVPQLTFDEWHGYWTWLDLDPEATFAHWINYQMKQKQESEKGTLRALVVKTAKTFEKSESNKAVLEKLAGRPEIVAEIESFQTAINDNLVGKPVSTEKKQKDERLAVAEKVADANPELFRQLAQMSPEQIKNFLAQTAASNG